MLVTEFGISIEVKPIQPEKASFPILVTELGISIDVSSEQPLKAEPPILSTDLGMTVFLHPDINSLLSVLMIALQLVLESNTGLPDSTTMEVSPEHLTKGFPSILVTELGISIEVKPEQSAKAAPSRLITECGISIEVKN